MPLYLAPLSFEDAVRALAAMLPMTEPKRLPAISRRKSERKKTDYPTL